MAEKRTGKENLKPWQPGQSGNPSGKKKGLLTAQKVTDLVSRLSSLNRMELQAVVADPKSTMLEITFASVLVNAAKSGDYSRLEFLMARSIGKVKDQLEVSTIKPYIIHKPDGSALELGAKQDVIDGDVEDTE